MSRPTHRFLAPALAAPLVAAMLATIPGSAGPARAASFDCARAATPTERAVCGDPRLSALDGRLGVVYGQRVALDPGLRQIQRGWLLARNAGCGDDRGCLMRMMNAELAWFSSGVGRPSGRLPTSEGACSLTQVTRLGSRLEGDPQSGSAAEEANGADQISYDVIAAIQRTRRGDPALVCLISLPTDCPAGDDRGKVYAVANLRTLGAWSAPDSEHGCGGA